MAYSMSNLYRSLRRGKTTAQVALVPAVLITLLCFVGAALWTIVMSFTTSRLFPEYSFAGLRQYIRLFHDDLWLLSLKNLVIFGFGSLGSLILGFFLAVAMNRDVKGEGVFRTILLYPLAVSLIITGLVWQWIFNPEMGLQQYVRNLGFEHFVFDWITRTDRVIYTIVIASIWQSAGFYMVLMLAGLRSIDSEIWKAAKIDGIPSWRLYLEVIIPTMKFNIVTCLVLLLISIVKSYAIIVAMTNGGPGGHSVVPSYFIVSSYFDRVNIAYASAGAVVMLLIVVGITLPILLFRLVMKIKTSAGNPANLLGSKN